MAQPHQLLNGSLALQGEGGSAPAKGECRWVRVKVRCPCALLPPASQEPGCWRSLESTKAMTEKLWAYYGKKRMGWMTGGTASPSADLMSLWTVQWACLAHGLSWFCSRVVCEHSSEQETSSALPAPCLRAGRQKMWVPRSLRSVGKGSIRSELPPWKIQLWLHCLGRG